MTTEPSPLTAAEIRELTGLLQARRAELTASRLRHLESTRASGEAASEEGDQAEQEIEADRSATRVDTERLELQEIEHALGKIASGELGLSEESGEPIGIARLRLVPTARLTVIEQERVERQQAAYARE
jgi:DnaK suppressor protein